MRTKRRVIILFIITLIVLFGSIASWSQTINPTSEAFDYDKGGLIISFASLLGLFALVAALGAEMQKNKGHREDCNIHINVADLTKYTTVDKCEIVQSKLSDELRDINATMRRMIEAVGRVEERTEILIDNYNKKAP